MNLRSLQRRIFLLGPKLPLITLLRKPGRPIRNQNPGTTMMAWLSVIADRPIAEYVSGQVLSGRKAKSEQRGERAYDYHVCFLRSCKISPVRYRYYSE